MFATMLLTLALTGQYKTSLTGFADRLQAGVLDPRLPAMYEAWLQEQSAAMQAQNDAYLRAEYQRQLAQQTRLKARKAQLRAKTAPKPNTIDKPAPIVLTKQAREEQIKKNLAKNRK